jgi:hypothetical protein
MFDLKIDNVIFDNKNSKYKMIDILELADILPEDNMITDKQKILVKKGIDKGALLSTHVYSPYYFKE